MRRRRNGHPQTEGWQGALVRRSLGQLRIGPDIVRHLSTFQRLGAPITGPPPVDTLPVVARVLLRGIRTRSVADISPDWLWPHWLSDQLDPTSQAFTPRGHVPVLQNVTARNWTAVGNPWSRWEAIVDRNGLVTPTFDGWSLDWWVHDGQRWRFPSTEDDIHQALLGSVPVVVTTMPVPGGEVTEHVYGVECVPEVAVVEILNRSDRRLRIAFAARPANPEGLAVIERLAIDGSVVEVDGYPRLSLPGVPEQAVLSTFAEGDSAGRLDDPEAQVRGHAEVRCRAGMAHGAFAYELPAGGQLRAALPLAPLGPRPRWRLPWRRRLHAALPAPERLPTAERIGRDWERRLERGLGVELPDERLQRAVDANRAYLLLLHDPGAITAGPFTYHRFWFRDAAYTVAALDRWGFHAEAADVLRAYPARQRPDGYFASQWREWDANGIAIWTVAEHHRLTGDRDLLDKLVSAVALGARWIIDTCASDRGKAPEARGLLPPGISAEHLGPHDYYYWDNLWALAGLRDAAAIARWRGDQRGAARADAGATRLEGALFSSIRLSAQRAGRGVITAGPTRGIDAGMIGGLAATWPLELLAADHPWIAETAEVIRDRYTIGPAFYQGIAHTGLGTYLTLQLAFVELLAGDLRAWRRLEWLLGAATPTFTWPEAIHPQLSGGCMGDGHHGWMAADLLNFVRTLLVRDEPEGLALLSLLPPAWRGERVSVQHAPTHHGLLSYELGWEEGAAVLTWECERPVRLRAPGLDPSWVARERAGRHRFKVSPA